MDLQTMLDNAVEHQRAEEMKTSAQLTLGELILKLESLSPIYKYENGEETEKEVKFDFEYLHPNGLSSWRGSYSELAINFSSDGKNSTLKEFITELKGAIGKTYQGYKGGDFLMGKTTPIWVANYGNSGETAVVDVEDRKYYVILKTAYCKY